ncbi:MAG: FAD-binding oxidoreductase [Gemmatimonadota bacterium]
MATVEQTAEPLRARTRTGGDVTVDAAAVHELEDRLRGPVLRAGDEGYDEARRIWNAMIDKRPALIARCTGAADVIDALRWSREHDLLVSVRGGGHNVAGNALCDGGLTMDLSGLRSVHVDPAARTARAEPGVTLGDIDRETQAFGLAVPTGIVSMTGIAGLTLGGGFGWLSRKHGLTCDNLRSADVVTAEGELLRASADERPELFWGLRGGGGNFGIVTSFEYELHELGPEVAAGLVLYPMARAPDVLRFYREFAASGPDELGLLAVLRLAPPAPFLPESVHGQPIVGIAACYAGPVDEGMRVLDPITERLGQPLGGGFGPRPFRAHQAMFDSGQVPGNQQYWKSEYLARLSDDAIETAIGFAERLTSPITGVLIFQLAGAIARVGEEETAVSHRDAEFVLAINSGWSDAADSDRQIEWTRDFHAAMQPFSTGGVYVNFLSRDEGEDRVRAAYGDEKHRRLVELKNRFDPENVFRVNQNIRPTV